MWDFLVRGGPVMIPLGLCSLLAATITIERVLALRRSRVVPREILHIIDAVEPGRDVSVAVSLCARNPGVFSTVMRVGLENAQAPWEVVRDAVLDAGRQEIPLLERNLVWLETIAAISPLLGLLGTVTGMMRVFAAISTHGLGEPTALSGGISEALIATATGLTIGIPTLVAHNVLAARAEALVVEIEAHASRLLARLQPRGTEVAS
jgi:biopolymer transport protein ExbB